MADKYAEAREKLRKEMKANPNKAYSFIDVRKKFGIPKHLIDRKEALSYKGSHIFRSKVNGGVRWTYVPSGSKPDDVGGRRTRRKVLDELKRIAKTLQASGYFDPKSKEDERKKTLKEICQRQGQDKFRRQLLAAYGQRCSVSGCDVVEALEAAHIIPYLGPKTHHVSNGLLLRSDIHTLFDIGLIGIEPDSLKVVSASGLKKSQYKELDGKKVTVPSKRALRPSLGALQQKWEEFNG